jgi:putative oxidoreductase
MVAAALKGYDAIVARLSGRAADALMLLFVRIVLAGIFWRSGQTKLDAGGWRISDLTYELFRTEYAGVPLPSNFAAVAATIGEHLFPALLLIGLFTRLSALALLGMTLVIQFFVYPEAWWPVHSLWVALALVLIARGGGPLAVDAPLARRVRQ